MSVVFLLESLLARRVQVVAAGRNDVVAAVCRGVVDRLVLAHEADGDLRCNAAERSWVGADVDGVPGAGVC